MNKEARGRQAGVCGFYSQFWQIEALPKNC